MRVSEILHAGVEQFLELTPSIIDHLETTGNPHGLTKETVGLGNVSDDKQATETDFRAHVDARILDHPDKSVTTQKIADGAVSTVKLAPDAVTAEKIADDSVGSGALKNESVANEHLTIPLRNVINGKVDREDGMGLSQNSFTDEEKNKLATISVTDGTADIDAASLLSRSLPLKIRKTGQGFETVPTDMYLSDVSEVVCYDTFPANGYSVIGYKNTSGNFVSTFFKDGTLLKKYEGGTGAGHCTVSFSNLLCAEAKDGVLTITKAMAQLKNPSFSTWVSLPISVTGEVVIRHLFLRWVTDIRKYELTVIYAPVNYSYLYIDCFQGTDSTDFVQKWQLKLRQDSHTTSNTNITHLVYSSWFRMACMDGSGTLYVAPIYGTTEPYGVLRINTNGEITARYRKLDNTGYPQYVMRDLLLCGKYLYAYAATDILRIDTDTGEEMSEFLMPNGSAWWPRGLMMLPDGHLALYALSPTTGLGHILLFYTTGEHIIVHSRSILSDTELADTALYCRSVSALAPEIEGLYLNAETGELTSKRFRGYDEYTVI